MNRILMAELNPISEFRSTVIDERVQKENAFCIKSVFQSWYKSGLIKLLVWIENSWVTLFSHGCKDKSILVSKWSLTAEWKVHWLISSVVIVKGIVLKISLRCRKSLSLSLIVNVPFCCTVAQR